MQCSTAKSARTKAKYSSNFDQVTIVDSMVSVLLIGTIQWFPKIGGFEGERGMN